MRPDEGDLDDEIRHLAINIKERIDRGEDPVSARRAHRASRVDPLVALRRE